MTKRFEMKDPNCWGYPITDNKTGKVYNCDSNIWMKELVGVLNALHEENEYWKKRALLLENKYESEKVSVEDIIGLVKTDEPTNSVELKKELYK